MGVTLSPLMSTAGLFESKHRVTLIKTRDEPGVVGWADGGGGGVVVDFSPEVFSLCALSLLTISIHSVSKTQFLQCNSVGTFDF